MKKLLIILSILLVPYFLQAQNHNVRTEVTGTEATLYRGLDTLNPYIPYSNRSSITITTDGGVIRFWENGEELRVMAYSPLYETNYYVKTGGDDTKSGLTDADAWAHHPWMSTWTGSTVLVKGDVVNMKRGDTWTIASPGAAYMTVAQSGEAGKPITTTAYGTGADPIIKISTATNFPVVYADAKAFITFDNLHIQHHSSTRDLGGPRHGFQLENVCHDVTFTNNEIDNIPFNAIFVHADAYNITIGDVLATTCATTTAYSNNIHDFGYAGVFLSGCNPVGEISNFNVFYNYIHDAPNSTDTYGVTIEALVGSTAWPKYVYVKYNRVEDITRWEALGCHGGSYIYFDDNYIYNFGARGIWLGGYDGVGALAATSNHLYARRNTVENPATGWSTGSEMAFICQYSASTVTQPSDIVIEDNICRYVSDPAVGPFYGIEAFNVDGITITGNQIYNGHDDAGSAFYIGTTVANGCLDVTLENNYVNEWGYGINIKGSSILNTLKINSNIIKSLSVDCVIITGASLTATSAVTMYDNTLLTESYTSVIFSDYGITASGSLTAENNIIGSTSATNMYYWRLAGTVDGTLVCDYNLYWNSGFVATTPMYIYGANHSTAEWVAHGFDANSNADFDISPLFTNAGGSYGLVTDFSLGGGSPAINTGTNTGITLDYYGNPRVGNYDIGAIEVQ